jgi:hypothetical protein
LRDKPRYTSANKPLDSPSPNKRISVKHFAATLRLLTIWQPRRQHKAKGNSVTTYRKRKSSAFSLPVRVA